MSALEIVGKPPSGLRDREGGGARKQRVDHRCSRRQGRGSRRGDVGDRRAAPRAGSKRRQIVAQVSMAFRTASSSAGSTNGSPSCAKVASFISARSVA